MTIFLINTKKISNLVATDTYYRGETIKEEAISALIKLSEENNDIFEDLLLSGVNEVEVLFNKYLGKCYSVLSRDINGDGVVELHVNTPALWEESLSNVLTAAIHDFIADFILVEWLRRMKITIEGKGGERLRDLINRRRMPRIEDYKNIRVVEL